MRRPPVLASAALSVVLAATAVAFLPALGADFVNWDDPRNFLDNPHFRGLGAEQLRWMFTARHMGHYIPVTWLTLGLDHVVWGMDPRGYHLTSLVIHLATVALFFLLARRLLAAAWDPGGPGSGAAVFGAAVAAALFAIHPLRVESVVWITERRDVVSGFFYCAALLAYLAAVARPAPMRSRAYWAAVALFACALLSKSLTVSLPVALVVLDVYPLRRLGGARGWRVPAVWLEKAPFVALSVAAVVMGFTAIVSDARLVSFAQMGVLARLAVTVYGLAFYVIKTVAPVHLTPLYELPIVITWGHWALVAALGALAVALRRRWPAFTAAAIVYATTLFPVVGLLQNGPQMAADRYSYLSCMGWAILLGGLAGRRHRTWAVRGLAAAVVAALAVMTWQQSGVWRNSVTLWSQAVAVSPEGKSSHYHLARALDAAGRPDEAVAMYRQVQRLTGDPGRWHLVIGEVLERRGRHAEAFGEFAAAAPFPAQEGPACAGARRTAARLATAPAIPPACR
jgi:hypothetical protein